MTEFQILSAIKNNGGSIGYTDLLNLNMTDTVRDPLADKARIEQLISKKLLAGATDAYCQLSITNEGRMHLQNAQYLEEHQNQLAEDVTNNKTKEYRHNWFITIVGAFITGLITLALNVATYFLLG